jgi:DNA adenine methylase
MSLRQDPLREGKTKKKGSGSKKESAVTKAQKAKLAKEIRLNKQDLMKTHSKRSQHAQKIDEAKRAKIAPSLAEWKKHPEKYDVTGVDYPVQEQATEYDKKSIKPVIKWVGGKRQIEDVLYDLSPTNYEQYWEPFKGGLAMFFKHVREGRIDAAVVSDYNKQLPIMYSTLEKDPESIIALLESKEFENTKENYYKIRSWDRKENWVEWMNDPENAPRVAARVIFLTKLSFNALWRENSKGQHNAPYCQDESKKTFDRDNLLAVSRELKGINIGHASYEYLKKENWWKLAEQNMPPTPEDFFYFDPPYVDTFVGYTKKGFNFDNIKELKQITDDLSSIGAYTMMSHTDHPEIRELFKDYRIVQIKTHARINRDPKKRKHAMNEVIIMNYDENNNVLDSIAKHQGIDEFYGVA